MVFISHITFRTESEDEGSNICAGGKEVEICERNKIDDRIIAVLMEFHQIFPDFIEIESDNRARSFSSSKVIPKIKLLPNVKGTWLDTPKPAFKSDEIGSWPKDTKFPTAEKSLLPSNNI